MCVDPATLLTLPRDGLIALIEAQAGQIVVLAARIAELEARLAAPPKTPDNSSLPPSKGQKPNRPERPKPPHPGRPGVARALAEHPDWIIEATLATCPHCDHAIGELRCEQLDIVPAQLRVRVTRRPRYACRACEGAVMVTPAPARPIHGGMATEALIAHVMVSEFWYSLPLYRQAQMLARQGAD